jgi:hypothetical protein
MSILPRSRKRLLDAVSGHLRQGIATKRPRRSTVVSLILWLGIPIAGLATAFVIIWSRTLVGPLPPWADSLSRNLFIGRVVSFAHHESGTEQTPLQTPPPVIPAQPTQALTDAVVHLIGSDARLLANQIRQDFNAGIVKGDAQNKQLDEGALNDLIKAGDTPDQAQRALNSRGSGTGAARMMGRINESDTAIMKHHDDIERLVDLAWNNKADPRRELVSRMLELQQSCTPMRRDSQAMTCVERLNQVAALAP